MSTPEAIKAHYDVVAAERPDRAHADDFTCAVRACNNFLKAAIIHVATSALPLGALLDVCGGTGGDIGKWSFGIGRRRLQHWCAVDVSPASLAEYRRRYRNSRMPHRIQFVEADVSSDAGRAKVTETFYTHVSAMMCLNYFSRDQLPDVVGWMTQRAGGPRGVCAVSWLNAAHIEADDGSVEHISGLVHPTGFDTYNFRLAGSVEDLEEYAISFEDIECAFAFHGWRVYWYVADCDLFCRTSETLMDRSFGMPPPYEKYVELAQRATRLYSGAVFVKGK